MVFQINFCIKLVLDQVLAIRVFCRSTGTEKLEVKGWYTASDYFCCNLVEKCKGLLNIRCDWTHTNIALNDNHFTFCTLLVIIFIKQHGRSKTTTTHQAQLYNQCVISNIQVTPLKKLIFFQWKNLAMSNQILIL